ncbi:PqiC family protein [Telmatospirillum siberiense]|uniref:ABC-type transport auxiliary lipoprotein component domain-containing protein n=1 Tax=Telmatospirillum siberiense TaxID=382514 RepID=A0A2N3PXG8_9PROT|nr:PqiC family protein [Telmatospirillum siberiense]PKU25087.1 hypothetical protein CWS72_07730 [Telmatospirillum siberiense]
MTFLRSGLMATILVAALGGCGTSAPPRYHALGLVQPAPASGSARRLVEILPVAVPERLNREEVVLTGAGGQLDVRDGDHWAAPLPDEIRHILTDALWRRLRAADVYQAPVSPGAGGVPQYRLALQIERFEAVPGRSAVVEGSWTARRLPQGASATCRAGITVALPALTADAATAALSDGTSQLARLIADSIDGLEQGVASVCPADGY